MNSNASVENARTFERGMTFIAALLPNTRNSTSTVVAAASNTPS